MMWLMILFVAGAFAYPYRPDSFDRPNSYPIQGGLNVYPQQGGLNVYPQQGGFNSYPSQQIHGTPVGGSNIHYHIPDHGQTIYPNNGFGHGNFDRRNNFGRNDRNFGRGPQRQGSYVYVDNV